jgi:hypothetical protein
VPSFIVKPDPDDDFYVEWSTVVDAPTAYGSREELTADLGPRSGSAERFDRADEFGTSMCDPLLPRDDQFFGWNDKEFTVHNVGAPTGKLIARKDIRELCERLDSDTDISHLLKPLPRGEAE